ncbi:PHP domain-containing protein [Paenibacillus sp. KS-LC4]|uniref:PHP domain-containing protein n=1 Tax=Paenibacillus sp. KS-LC4 TaxID=2979727 RepID=UPI0030CDAB03
MGKVDLHTHTTASDGTGSPSSNVQLAKAAGLSAIAITDHDTMAGVEEALAEGERIGITVVPGVELSTVADGQDIHVLGYYANWRDELWQQRLTGLRSVRDIRNALIVAKLVELGIDITLSEVEKVALEHSGGALSEKTVGRPHIAELLVRKGAVSNMREAFDRYLASGSAAYVNPPRVNPYEAINWIKEAGGVSVLAHPGLYGNDELVEQLIRSGGVQGIEVYHSDHGPQEEARYLRLAEQYSLIITGGSDYHGEREGKVFHGAIGSRTVDVGVLKQMKSGLSNVNS